MSQRFASIATAAALTALFAGNAMAQMPASGEGPLFLNEGKTVSTVSRDTVRHDAVAQRPASGAFDGTTTARNTTSPSREAVRQEAAADLPARRPRRAPSPPPPRRRVFQSGRDEAPRHGRAAFVLGSPH